MHMTSRLTDEEVFWHLTLALAHQHPRMHALAVHLVVLGLELLL